MPVQVEVARDFIAKQEAAAGKDIKMVAGDWLSPEVLDEEFDLGYDYTCALLHQLYTSCWCQMDQLGVTFGDEKKRVKTTNRGTQKFTK